MSIELIHADCLEYMPTIPDKSIDMILCDLPYGTTACKWDTIIPFAALWTAYKRLITSEGVIVLTSSEPFTSFLITSNISMFKHRWVWNKVKPSTGLNAKKSPLRVVEDICVFAENTPVYNPQMEIRPLRIDNPRRANNGEAFGGQTVLRQHTNYGKAYPKDLLTISNANQNNRIHPTQKPVALMEYLIKTYTNPGMVVLDNCMGSGTAGVACKNLGRSFIGIEKDETYFKIAEQRINEKA